MNFQGLCIKEYQIYCNVLWVRIQRLSYGAYQAWQRKGALFYLPGISIYDSHDDILLIVAEFFSE